MRRVVGFAWVLVPILCWGQPDTLWTRTYIWAVQDPGNIGEPHGVVETSDGGYLIAGRTYRANEDVGLIRTDSNGDTLWTKALDSGYPDGIIAMCPGTNGQYRILLSASDVAAIDTAGDTLWTCMGGGRDSWSWDYYDAHSLASASGGSVILSGCFWFLHPDSSWDVYPYAMKVGSNGAIVWQCFISTGTITPRLNAGVELPDGNLIVMAQGTHLQGFKVNSAGAVLWRRDYGAVYDNYGQNAVNCILSSSGYCYLSHYAQTGDFRVIKIRATGDTLWTRSFPNWSHGDAAIDLHAMPDDGVIVTGTTAGSVDSSHHWTNALRVAQLDSSGNVTWDRNWRTPGGELFFGSSQLTSDGGMIIVSAVCNIYGCWDVLAVKIEPFLPASTAINHPSLPTSMILHPNFPNPFNSTTEIAFDLPRAGKVSLKVFDLLGREVAVVQDGMMAAGNHRVNFDGKDLASGVYVYRLQAGEVVSARKMVVLK